MGLRVRAHDPVLAIAGIGVGFALAFAFVYVVTVRTLSGRALSDASLRGALLTNGLLARVVNPVLSVVSVGMLLAAIALALLVALARGARHAGMLAIGLLVVSNLSTLLLKRYLLSRPELGLKEAAPSTLNSLPSGHSAAAMSVVVALLFVVPARLRWPTAVVGGAYAAVTGVATMSAGWHRAGDSLAAYVLVGFWGAVAGVVLFRADQGGAGPAVVVRRSHLARWWAVVDLGMLALGAAIAVLLAGADAVRDSVLGPPIAFVAGGLFIVGTAGVTVLGVVRILEICDRSLARPVNH